MTYPDGSACVVQVLDELTPGDPAGMSALRSEPGVTLHDPHAGRVVRIAPAARGVLGPVEFRPGRGARLWLRSGIGAHLVELFTSTLDRVNNRNIGKPESESLSAAAAARGGALLLSACHALISGRTPAEAADILSNTDRIRFLLPCSYREILKEFRDPRTDSLDCGLDIRTLEMGSAAGMADIVRRPDMVGELAALDSSDDRAYGAERAGRFRALVESSALPAAVGVSPSMDGEIVDYLAGRYTDRMREYRQRLRERFAITSEDAVAMTLRLAHAPAPGRVLNNPDGWIPPASGPPEGIVQRAPGAISRRSTDVWHFARDTDVVRHYARDRPKRGAQ